MNHSPVLAWWFLRDKSWLYWALGALSQPRSFEIWHLAALGLAALLTGYRRYAQYVDTSLPALTSETDMSFDAAVSELDFWSDRSERERVFKFFIQILQCAISVNILVFVGNAEVGHDLRGLDCKSEKSSPPG